MSSASPFQFDQEKAKEAILYIANRVPMSTRFYVCKIFYFADRYHLENYARFICGDYYAAMKNGPVPSGVYDMIKAADRGDVADIIVDDRDITATRDANVELLSESDVEALDYAIKTYGGLPVSELWELSHDEDWKATTRNGELLTISRSIPIPIERIAALLKDGDAILDYLHEYY